MLRVGVHYIELVKPYVEVEKSSMSRVVYCFWEALINCIMSSNLAKGAIATPFPYMRPAKFSFAYCSQA